MKGRSHLSIGEVLSLLQTEFPDITISKIRFLESQGLLDPERTPSGYRKFYPPDLQQLRYILVQQRDHFLPLKVIKDRIAAGMHLPAEGERGAGDEAEGGTGPAGAGVRVVGIGGGLGATGRNGSDTGGPPDPLDGGQEPGAEDRPDLAAGGASPGGPTPTVHREATSTEAVGAERRVGVEAPEFGGARSAGLAGAPVPAGATIGEGTARRASAVASATGLPPSGLAPSALPPSGTEPAAQPPTLADPSSGPPDPLAGPAARVPTSSDADAPLANGLGAPGVDPAEWSSEPNAVRPEGATAGSGAASGPGGSRSGGAGAAAARPATTAHGSGDTAGAPGRTGADRQAVGGDPADDDALTAGGTGVDAVVPPEASGGSARPPVSSGADRPADPATSGRNAGGEDDPAVLAAPASGRAAGRQASSGAGSGSGSPSGPAGAGRRRSSGPGGGERDAAASSGRRGSDLTSVSLSLTELAGAAGLEVNELRDLERYGVVVGRRVGADTVYGDEALLAAQVAARFRRHGIEARHLRAYRMAADREVGLFEQVVAPQLRARSLGPGNTPAETLDELEELGESLRHVLVRQALHGLIDGG